MSGIFQDVLKEAKSMAACKLKLSGTDAVRLDDISVQRSSTPLSWTDRHFRALSRS